MPVVSIGESGSLSTVVLWDSYGSRPATVVTSGSTASGYAAINVKDPATWNAWRPTAVPSYVRYDIISGSAPSNAVGISAHNAASSGGSIAIEYSNDGVNFTRLTRYSPLTDDDILFLFPSITARYWQVVQLDAPFNVGVWFLGARLTFPHAPTDDYVALHHGRRYTKLFNDSIKGHFLGNRVMAAGAETEVDMGFMDRAFTEGPLRGFESHYNQGGTFFYASCPAKLPIDMGYCRALGDDETMDVTFIEADKLSNVSFGLRAYVGV